MWKHIPHHHTALIPKKGENTKSEYMLPAIEKKKERKRERGREGGREGGRKKEKL